MRICAAVPVKEPLRAKSRLAGVVPDRAAFAMGMLHRVLDALSATGGLAEIAVVSPDPAVLTYAASRGLTAVAQHGAGLNQACDLAAAWARSQKADGLLLAHGDLPWLEPADVAAMVALLRPGTVVLAPDRRGRGTNALLVSPADGIPFAFGADSFRAHQDAARRSGLAVATYRSRGTEHDVDLPADLADLPETLSPVASQAS